MEKRALLAIILSTIVIIIWFRIFPPPKPAAVPPSPEKTAAAAPEMTPTATPEKAPPMKAEAEAPPAAPQGEIIEGESREDILIETEEFTVLVDTRGARVKSWRLRHYTDENGAPLELVPREMSERDFLPLAVDCGNREWNEELNKALYRVTRPVSPGATSGKTVQFEYANGKDLFLRKTIHLPQAGFVGEVSAELVVDGKKHDLFLMLGPGLGNPPKSRQQSRYLISGRVFVDREGKIRRIDAAKAGESTRIPGQGTKFCGIEDNYFTEVFLSDSFIDEMALKLFTVEIEETPPKEEPGKEPEAVQKPPRAKKKPEIKKYLAVGPRFSPEKGKLSLFVGPKDTNVLGAVDPALKRIVDYGFFGWIAQLLLIALNFFYGFLKNYGLAIILLTVIIKVLFFPLTYKSLISMEKMKALQPKVKQINEKYKKTVRDPKLRREMTQKKNEELMALYRKEGVNPAGGCLPLLLQMPVLWAMYRLLGVAIELRHAPFFLWIKDLSAADPYLILPIVMGVSMIVQQVMTPSSADPRQKKMFYVMSIMFTYFFLYLPSGLVLYWLVNNILSILQQWIINKRMKGKEEAAKEAEKEAKRLKKALRQSSARQ